MSSVASAAAYNAADQMTSLAYLGGTETRAYNNLSQLTGLQLGTQTNVSYYYNAGTNNGQIATAIDTAHNQTVNYSYDSLKRLSAAYYTSLNLVDPGLEQTAVNGWTLTEGASESDLQSRSWPYSLQATGGSAAVAGTCVANASYTASGYYMAASGSAATVTTVGGSSQTNTLSAASGWTAFSFTFTAPSNCAGGVSMVLGGGAPGEPVYSLGYDGSVVQLTHQRFYAVNRLSVSDDGLKVIVSASDASGSFFGVASAQPPEGRMAILQPWVLGQPSSGAEDVNAVWLPNSTAILFSAASVARNSENFDYNVYSFDFKRNQGMPLTSIRGMMNGFSVSPDGSRAIILRNGGFWILDLKTYKMSGFVPVYRH